jgi:hypothetical protein
MRPRTAAMGMSGVGVIQLQHGWSPELARKIAAGAKSHFELSSYFHGIFAVKTAKVRQ